MDNLLPFRLPQRTLHGQQRMILLQRVTPCLSLRISLAAWPSLRGDRGILDSIVVMTVRYGAAVAMKLFHAS